MNGIKKIIVVLFFISFLGIFSLYAADTETDYISTKAKVLEVQSVNNNLPTSLSTDERKGSIGYIISKLFDNNGKIGNWFIKALGTRSDGAVLRWSGGNGGELVEGTIYDNGTNVGIGNTDPNYTLDVTGIINATSLRGDGSVITNINGNSITDNTIDSSEIQDNSIINADINSTAAISGSKISPDFGIQSIIGGNLIVGTSIQIGNLSNDKIYSDLLSGTGGGIVVSISSSNDSTTYNALRIKRDGRVQIDYDPLVGSDVGNRDYNDARYMQSGGAISGDDITDDTIDSSEIEDDTLTEDDISDAYVARDSSLLDGYNSSESNTPSTIAVRNSSGDINARMFKSGYDTTSATVGYIMTQIDTVNNNYIRPTTPSQFRAAVTDSIYVSIGSSGDQILDDTIDSSEIEDNTLTALDLAENSIGNSELINTEDFTMGGLSLNEKMLINQGANYDIYIQGGTGGVDTGEARNLAFLGIKANDQLRINFGGEYLGGTRFDGEVTIGSASPSAGLKLDVDGKIGATEYCDEDGVNCVAPSGIGTYLESGAITYAAGASWNHGLGARPNMFGAYIQAKVANNGYAIGDRVNLSSLDGDGARKSTVYGNSTKVAFNMVSDVRLAHATAATAVTISSSQWDLIFWVLN